MITISNDLISRQAAIDAICKVCSMTEDYHKCDGYPETSTWCDELVALRALPSAQPEIIHCRDRKHWEEGGMYSYCRKLFNCGVLDVYDYMRSENDFCSLAERRTDESEKRTVN